MSISDLGSGQPFMAAIINTFPKQLRFIQKFDQIYTIRYSYIPRPPEILNLTQELYIPVSYHESVYRKFVELVAIDMGEDGLAAKFQLLYDQQRRKDRALAATDHLTEQGMEYSDFA